MDDEDDENVEAPKAKGSSTKLIIIISVIAFLAVGGSVAATLFLTGSLSDDESVEVSEKSTKAKAPKQKAKAQYIELEPPFTVNFADQQNVRFLQIAVQLMTRDTEVVDSVNEHNPMIRNNLVLLFSSQSAVMLGSREGKEQLRKDTLEEVNKILKVETGKAGVEAVYFTSMVMQ